MNENRKKTVIEFDRQPADTSSIKVRQVEPIEGIKFDVLRTGSDQ